MIYKNKVIKRICDFILKYEVLIFILLAVAFFRLPTLWEPNRYADEDIYLTLGMGLRRGLVFYRDIHDNKPPLLYLVAALASSVMWFRFILMFWHLVNVVLVWKLAQKLFKRARTVGIVTVIFAILSTIPLTEGNIANGEIFMIMPVTAAVLLLLDEAKIRSLIWNKYLVAGILFSIGFLFKVPVLFDFVGICFWLFIYSAKDLKTVIGEIRRPRAWLLMAGFVLPILLSIGYYYSVGAGDDYIKAALGQNVSYVSSWEGGEKAAFYESGMVQRLFVASIWIGAIYLLRKKIGVEAGLVMIWLVMALFGANLSGRPYPHYLLQLVVPLALLIGLMIERGRLIKYAGVGLLLTLALALWRYQFWFYPSTPYYLNFGQYALGMKTQDEYYDFFGGGVRRNYEIGEYIRMRTDTDERIYVWGTEPAIYVIANRLPVYKYTASYHVKDFRAHEATMEALRVNPPKYIVVMDYEDEFAELESMITASYTKAVAIDGAVIYRRVN